MRFILFCFLSLTLLLSYGQTSDIKDYLPTENLDKKKDSNRKKNAPDEKRIRYIIKNSGEGILYGNPCMVEATRKMRFEYAVQIPGLPGSLGPVKRNWENLRTWMHLAVFRSPFWKLVLKSRVKNCRKKSGDLVG